MPSLAASDCSSIAIRFDSRIDAEQACSRSASRRRCRWPSCPGPCSRPTPGSPARRRRAACAGSRRPAGSRTRSRGSSPWGVGRSRRQTAPSLSSARVFMRSKELPGAGSPCRPAVVRRRAVLARLHSCRSDLSRGGVGYRSTSQAVAGRRRPRAVGPPATRLRATETRPWRARRGRIEQRPPCSPHDGRRGRRIGTRCRFSFPPLRRGGTPTPCLARPAASRARRRCLPPSMR